MSRHIKSVGTDAEVLKDLEKQLRGCTTIEEYLEVRSEAAGHLSRLKAARAPIEQVNVTAIVKLSAERELGFLLRAMKLRGGDRRIKSMSRPATLSDRGITRMQSSRWQCLARISQSVFREFTSRCGRRRIFATHVALVNYWRAVRLKEDNDH